MSIPKFSIKRPILTIMVTLIIFLLGAVSLSKLPVDLMPDISSPTLSVMTSYPNAGPQEIEELISRPIEEAVGSVPGVEEITSTSSEGNSRVRISFTWGTDLSEAANDIRERIDRIVQNLPEDAERPRLLKFDLASFPIIIMGVEADLNPAEIQEIIDDKIKYRLEKVPGVASLDIWGGQLREIHVNVDKNKLLGLGLNLDNVIQQLRAQNIQLPAGNLEKENSEITLRTLGKYESLEQLEKTIIGVNNGIPIQLKEIASVKDSYEKVQRIIRINGKPGVRLAVRKQSGTNTVEVAENVLKEIDNINADITEVKLTPIVDTSGYIKTAIKNVGSAVIYGGILTLFILLLFLRNLKITFVIAIAIPVSIVATFTLMFFGNFTLNIMSLGGLALGVGMLVDNAIVVLENIFRKKEEESNQENAAIKGSEEVTAAIIASTLTTLVIFLPLLFISGVSGIMFQQLAYVIGFALICSLGVALTIVPMLTSKLLNKKDKFQTFEEGKKEQKGFFSKVENSYKDLLSFSLNYKIMIISFVFIIFTGCLFLTPFIGTEFMPTADENEVDITGEMEVGTKSEELEKRFIEMEKIVREKVPELKSTLMDVGTSGWGNAGSHKGQLRVMLVGSSERKRSSKEIANDILKDVNIYPGMTIRTREGRGLFIFRMVSGGNTDKVQIDIRGYDFKTANKLAARVKELVETIPGITDTQLSIDPGKPEQIVTIDRVKAENLRVTVSSIAQTLQTIVSGRRASEFTDNGKEYNIIVKVDDAEKLPVEELLNLTVNNVIGEPIPLKSLVKIQTQDGPVSIERKDKERVIGVSANTSSSRPLSEILSEIQEKVRQMDGIPEGFNIALSGDYEEQQKSFKELLISLVLALILVYMVMASLYESLLNPLVVMFSVPLAAIGVIITLILTDTTFNVQTFIGCIMLGGIVVNNAIILVDQINLLRRENNFSLRDAVEEGGRRRLRPILMTTLTTILGLFPLALGIGEGSETQAPMARAVIGGMTSSTIITLIIIPIVYYIFESWKEKLLSSKNNNIDTKQTQFLDKVKT